MLVAIAIDKKETIRVLNRRNAVAIVVYLAFALLLGSYRLII
jgi:hypothetical protein